MTASAAKTFVRSERAALCDLFDKLGPDHPTLCAGWETHDLAAHLWIRENDPIGAGGIAIKPLGGWYERRAAEAKQRWPYAELVDKIRVGPRTLSPFAIPGVDAAANSLEFFVHHEDVRRAGDAAQPARPLDPEVEDLIWRRLKLLARGWFRRAQVGVVLERLDGARDAGGSAGPDSIRAVAGSPIVTLVGEPSELLLFANGRTSVAEVKIIGEPAAIDLLHAADLRV
ncbi:TIGR03085 family metal-binding protein [Microlunatus ginsengisoli]|uniref:TIGR03085 family metal-binding protein n=1 Tax=Microlunatus ginsengisoli TaxID=363863 RepID=A0ABP6ZIQ6_9ACTN